MNICITPNSIKLFGAYINKQLDNQVTIDKSAENLLSDLFGDSVNIFKGNGLTEERNKELILQHFSIVPQLVLKHIASNPKLAKAASFEKIQSLAQNVIDATEDSSSKAFQEVITDMGKLLGNKSIIVDNTNPTDRFVGVSSELFKTSNQEAIDTDEISFTENKKDPAKVFEFAVSRAILRSSNNLSYRLKLTTLGEMLSDPSFVNTTGSTESSLPVLVLIDSNDAVVKFDENGSQNSKGKIPGYTVKLNRTSLKFQENRLADVFMKGNSTINRGEAISKAKQQVQDFVDYVDRSIEKNKKGTPVYFNIDLVNSSIGMISFNRNVITPLSQITNLNEQGSVIMQKQGLPYYPVIAIKNTNSVERVWEKPLSTLTDDEFEMLHYLLTEPKINMTGFTEASANKPAVRKNLIHFFIDSHYSGPFEVTYVKNAAGVKTRMIRFLNDAPIVADTLTINQLKEFANKRWAKPVSAVEVKAQSSPPLKSINEVTHLGQYYYGEDGKVYESVGLRRSFANSNVPIDTLIYHVPVKLVNNVIQLTDKISIREHVINVGETMLVPTADNELVGMGSYMAFTPGYEKATEDIVAPTNLLKFRSIGSRNLATVSTAQQDAKTLEWFKKVGLKSILGLEFSDEVSEAGPNFVASFIGNLITLYKGSSTSDIYHESFHAFFDGILSPSEKKAIYDTIKKTPGYFTTTVNGVSKLVAHSDATNIEIEEYLAEGFREYALSDGKKSNFSDNKIIAFFQKLSNLLKSIFGNMTYAEAKALNKTQGIIDATFNDLFRGNFNADMFVVTENEAKWNSFEVVTSTNDTFSLEEMDLLMGSMQSLLSDFIVNGINLAQNKEQQIISITLLSTMATNNVDSKEYTDAAAAYEELEKGGTVRSGNGFFLLNSNPLLLGHAVDYIKGTFTQQLKNINAQIEISNAIEKKNQTQRSQSAALTYRKALLEKTIKDDNFGTVDDIEKYKNETVNTTLLSVFLKDYSGLAVKQLFVDDFYEKDIEDPDKYVPEWNRTGQDQLLDELIDKQTEQVLGFIHEYSNQGKGNPVLNALGVKKILPLKNVLAKVSRVLKNSPNAMDMCQKLKALGRVDKEIEQVFRRLGDITNTLLTSNLSPAEHKQWTAFEQLMNKPEVLLREFILERTVDDKDPNKLSVKLVSKSGKSSSMSLQVGRSWDANFKYKLTTSIYQEIVNKIPVFNLEDFYNDYNELDKEGLVKKYYPKIQGPPQHTDKDGKISNPDFIESKFDSRKGTSKYDTRAVPEALANPFEFLAQLGIDMTVDDDIRKALFGPNSELKTDGRALEYINNSIKNRLSKVIWNPNGGVNQDGAYELDPNAKYITNLDNIFTKFKYRDETGQFVDQVDLFGYKDQLREIQYAYSNEYTRMSAFTADNKLKSERSFNSTLLVQVVAINSANSIEELIAINGMEHFDPTKNFQLAASKWFTDMFQLDPATFKGKNNGKRDWSISINVDNLSGSKIIEKYSGIEEDEEDEALDKFISYELDKGISAISSDEKTKMVSDFYLTMEGKPEIPRSGDKSTALTVYATTKKKGDARKGFNLPVNKTEISQVFTDNYNGTILFDEFKNHIASEIIRIQRVQKIKELILSGELSQDDIAIDVKQLNRGDQWFMFDKILTKGLKDELLKTKMDGMFSDKGFAIDSLSADIKKDIEAQLKDYFINESNLLLEEKGEDVVLSTNLLDFYQKGYEEDTVDDSKLKMFRAFTINNFLHNANYGALFLGDISIYDVEGFAFHKRISGLISTGKIFRHDDVFLQYLNSENYNAFGFSKQHNSKKGIVLDYSYNGALNTAILKESKSNSVYAEHFREMLDLDTSKYSNEGGADEEGAIDEADASGFVSFDAYKLLNESINEWSNAQEALYQKMLKGEKLTLADMTTTFPIRKFQYYGNVKNAKTDKLLESLGLSLTNMAFHKYALVPLIPALIKDKPLQALHEKMMEQGVHYVTMQTGSKLSSLTKVKVENGKIIAAPDDFYNTNKRGETNTNEDFEFTSNQIHVKSLKSQIFVSEGYKGYATLPTQLRKIVLVGLMNGGVPTDFVHKGTGPIKQAWDALSAKAKLKSSKKWQWLKEYDDTMDTMLEVLTDELLEDIELKVTTVNGKKQYVGDSRKLVQYLQEKLKSKDLLPEEIAFIAKPDGTLINDLSLSLVSEKIEELLISLADQKLRRLTVNGEALVQVTSSMHESNIKKPTIQDIEKYGNNDLSFYFLEDEKGNVLRDKNGKGIVKEMEVKISLQGNYKKLLYTKHPDNSIIAVYSANKDGVSELDYDLSLKRLNEAIKNEAWKADNKNLISTPGVRIPTQGPNVLVAATVAEFLPEYAGPILILPADFIAQTGADFDYDKLFMLFKNLLLVNNKIEQVKFIKNVNESYKELGDQVAEINVKQKVAREDVKAAWKPYLDYLTEKQIVNSEVNDMLGTIKNLRNDIDKQYANKQQVWANKKYNESQKIVFYQEIDDEIDFLKQAVKELDSIVQSDLSKFFDTTIKNKEDRANAVNELYEEYMSEINAKQSILDNLNDEELAVKRLIAGKGVKGLQNKLYDLFSERILMPDNLKMLVTANDTESVENKAKLSARKINKAFNKFGNKGNSTTGSTSITRTAPFEYRYNLQVHQENSVAVDALGIAAISTTFYALFTTFGATLQDTSDADQKTFENALAVLTDPTKENTIAYENAVKVLTVFNNKKLNFNTKDGSLGYNLNSQANALTLGLIKNVDGKDIANVLSQLVNGYVDVAKDAWIFDMQGTKENTPTLLMLVMAGVGTDSIIDFVNNPLVLEYNQYKKESSGVFSLITPDHATTAQTAIPKSNDSSAAIEKIAVKYKALFDPRNAENTAKSRSFNYNLIANAAPAFTPELLDSRVGKEPTFRDIEILSHYLQVEQMANELNEFTQLTKFDTTKIQSISDAQNRIENTEVFKLKKLEDKIIPNSWFDAIKDSVLGKFNKDEVLVDLFSQYFKIKNNKALVINSLDIRPPKGVDRAKVLADFKNDFMWFLYQNAVYGVNSYTTSPTKFVDDKIAIPGKTMTLVEDASLPVAYEINEETGVVKYSPKAVLMTMNMQEFHYSASFFDHALPKEKIKFILEYINLKNVSSELTDAQFKDKYYLFDNAGKSFLNKTGGRNIILQRAALYHTNNPKAMFDLSAGIGFILRNMMAKNPELSNYAFFRDLGFDFNENLKKQNIYFPQIKDPQIARVYRANINELKNHPQREIAEFFGKFTHIAIMQTGLTTGSKYAITKLGVQEQLGNVIEAEIGLKYINDVFAELDKSYANRETRKEADSQIIEQFKKLYKASIAGNGMRIKVRGYNYEVNKLNFSKVKELKETSFSYNPISIVPVDKTLTAGEVLLDVNYFYDDKTQTPLQIAEQIKDMPWSIRNEKIIAPKGKNKKELDVALLLMGIDNSGELPVLRYKSKNVKEGFLSISNSAIQKSIHVVKDEAMANASTKAIGAITTPLNPKYKSSSKAYLETLEADYPGTVAKVRSTKAQFTNKDKVWIFGSMSTANAYLGGSKDVFEKSIKDTFDKHHKPLIDKAIEAGVTSFFVGTANGIDAMAIEYLKQKDFTPVLRYASVGTYYELVPTSKLSETKGQGYTPSDSNVPAWDIAETQAILNELYGKDKKSGMPEWFSKKSDSEKEQGQQVVEDNIIAAIKKLDGVNKNQVTGFAAQFKHMLNNIGTGRIVVGNSIFSSFVEQSLMKFRTSIIASNAKLNQPVTQSSTSVKPGIEELFDSNPELANQVYEALGFNPQQKQQALQQYTQYLESLNKPNTNPVLQSNQQEQVKKFAELQERLNNKEFLEGAKGAYESTPTLQQYGTQEDYNDYIARVSLGIIKNPSSGGYNYTSKVKDIVYRGSAQKEDRRRFAYFTKNIGEASMFATAFIPKSGMMTERNPIAAINKEANTYIDNKYGKGIYEILSLPDDWQGLIYESLDITLMDLDYNLTEKGLKVFDELKEKNNKKEQLLKTIDKKDAELMFSIKEVEEKYNYVKIESDNDLTKPFDGKGYQENIGAYTKARNYIDQVLGIYNIRKNIGKLERVLLNIINPYIDEIVKEDLLNDSESYKNGHDGAILANGYHFLVNKSNNQIHYLGDEQDVEGFKNFAAQPVTSVVENNEQYNEAVIDYLREVEVTVLKVGDTIELTYKTSDSEGEATITGIQKLSNGQFRIKISPSKGKEYTYTVDNFGDGEKIEIEQFNVTVFEKNAGELEMAKSKLNSLAPIKEPVKQGYLSTPILSLVKEKYQISKSIPIDSNQVHSKENSQRGPIEVREGYKVTFTEHPTAIFYLTPDYGIIDDEEVVSGWKIENVNSGIQANHGSNISETFKTFVERFKQLQNVSLKNDQVVEIITVTGMDINKLTPDKNTEIKYTYFTLPFSKAEKANILINFVDKYMKGKSTKDAQKHIEEALAKADQQKQEEIIELLKECYI